MRGNHVDASFLVLGPFLELPLQDLVEVRIKNLISVDRLVSTGDRSLLWKSRSFGLLLGSTQ